MGKCLQPGLLHSKKTKKEGFYVKSNDQIKGNSVDLNGHVLIFDQGALDRGWLVSVRLISVKQLIGIKYTVFEKKGFHQVKRIGHRWYGGAISTYGEACAIRTIAR